MTFGMVRDLYRKRKYVVYGSHRSPVGNHVITIRPKPPYNFNFFLFEAVHQNYYITYNYDGVQELKLL